MDVLIDRDVLYNARIKNYPNDIHKYTVFNKLIFNPYNAELINKNNNRVDYIKSDIPVTRDDSLKRAKDRIFDIAFVNSSLWQFFITLTLDKTKIDRYDKKVINKKLKDWLYNMVRNYNFNYLIIPEYHKDGAVHFHGLVSGDCLRLSYVGFDKKGRELYNLDSWRLGFSSCVRLDDNRAAVSSYITKYVTKDTSKILGNVYYAGGHSLLRDCPAEYCNIDYADFQGREFKIPNTKIKVKYLIAAGCSDD